MIDLISSVDALFSYMGATIFVLGLIFCLIPRTFRFGIFAMLAGDIPLALAIAFPRRIIEFVLAQGVTPDQFPDPDTGHLWGIGAGVGFVFLLFILRMLLVGLFGRKRRDDDDAPVLSVDDEFLEEQNESDKDGKGARGRKGSKKKTKSPGSRLLRSQDIPLTFGEKNEGYKPLKENSGYPDNPSTNANGTATNPENTFGNAALSGLSADDDPVFSNDFLAATAHQDAKNAAAAAAAKKQQQQAQAQSGTPKDLADRMSRLSSLAMSVAQEQEQGNAAAQGAQGAQGAASASGGAAGADGASQWSGLMAKINAANAQNQAQPNGQDGRGQSAAAQDVGSGLEQIPLAGSKVGQILDVIDNDDTDAVANLKQSLSKPKEDSGSFGAGFADILNSAAERQNRIEHDHADNRDAHDLTDTLGRQAEDLNDNRFEASAADREQSPVYPNFKRQTVAEVLAALEAENAERESEEAAHANRFGGDRSGVYNPNSPTFHEQNYQEARIADVDDEMLSEHDAHAELQRIEQEAREAHEAAVRAAAERASAEQAAAEAAAQAQAAPSTYAEELNSAEQQPDFGNNAIDSRVFEGAKDEAPASVKEQQESAKAKEDNGLNLDSLNFSFSIFNQKMRKKQEEDEAKAKDASARENLFAGPEIEDNDKPSDEATASSVSGSAAAAAPSAAAAEASDAAVSGENLPELSLDNIAPGSEEVLNEEITAELQKQDKEHDILAKSDRAAEALNHVSLLEGDFENEASRFYEYNTARVDSAQEEAKSLEERMRRGMQEKFGLDGSSISPALANDPGMLSDLERQQKVMEALNKLKNLNAAKQGAKADEAAAADAAADAVATANAPATAGAAESGAEAKPAVIDAKALVAAAKAAAAKASAEDDKADTEAEASAADAAEGAAAGKAEMTPAQMVAAAKLAALRASAKPSKPKKILSTLSEDETTRVKGPRTAAEALKMAFANAGSGSTDGGRGILQNAYAHHKEFKPLHAAAEGGVAASIKAEVAKAKAAAAGADVNELDLAEDIAAMTAAAAALNDNDFDTDALLAAVDNIDTTPRAEAEYGDVGYSNASNFVDEGFDPRAAVDAAKAAAAAASANGAAAKRPTANTDAPVQPADRLQQMIAKAKERAAKVAAMRSGSSEFERNGAGASGAAGAVGVGASAVGGAGDAGVDASLARAVANAASEAASNEVSVVTPVPPVEDEEDPSDLAASIRAAVAKAKATAAANTRKDVPEDDEWDFPEQAHSEPLRRISSVNPGNAPKVKAVRAHAMARLAQARAAIQERSAAAAVAAAMKSDNGNILSKHGVANKAAAASQARTAGSLVAKAIKERTGIAVPDKMIRSVPDSLPTTIRTPKSFAAGSGHQSRLDNVRRAASAAGRQIPTSVAKPAAPRQVVKSDAVTKVEVKGKPRAVAEDVKNALEAARAFAKSREEAKQQLDKASNPADVKSALEAARAAARNRAREAAKARATIAAHASQKDAAAPSTTEQAPAVSSSLQAARNAARAVLSRADRSRSPVMAPPAPELESVSEETNSLPESVTTAPKSDMSIARLTKAVASVNASQPAKGAAPKAATAKATAATTAKPSAAKAASSAADSATPVVAPAARAAVAAAARAAAVAKAAAAASSKAAPAAAADPVAAPMAEAPVVAAEGEDEALAPKKRVHSLKSKRRTKVADVLDGNEAAPAAAAATSATAKRKTGSLKRTIRRSVADSQD